MHPEGGNEISECGMHITDKPFVLLQLRAAVTKRAFGSKEQRDVRTKVLKLTLLQATSFRDLEAERVE